MTRKEWHSLLRAVLPIVITLVGVAWLWPRGSVLAVAIFVSIMGLITFNLNPPK